MDGQAEALHQFAVQCVQDTRSNVPQLRTVWHYAGRADGRNQKNSMSRYSRSHYLVGKLWGPARHYPCVTCGRPAHEWAYDHTDPSSPGGYSQWPEFYMPMCRSCHRRLDFARTTRTPVVRQYAPDPVPVPAGLLCRVPGCGKRRARRSYCHMHYSRILHYGGPGPPGRIGKAAPLRDRFINNVQVPGPVVSSRLGACHLWTGYVHESGYGAIGVGRRLVYVHRLAYQWAYGPIPATMTVVQMCGNRLCVRPDHLRARKRARPASSR
jgi:HNH endonuclease